MSSVPYCCTNEEYHNLGVKIVFAATRFSQMGRGPHAVPGPLVGQPCCRSNVLGYSYGAASLYGILMNYCNMPTLFVVDKALHLPTV